MTPAAYVVYVPSGIWPVGAAWSGVVLAFATGGVYRCGPLAFFVAELQPTVHRVGALWAFCNPYEFEAVRAGVFCARHVAARKMSLTHRLLWLRRTFSEEVETQR